MTRDEFVAARSADWSELDLLIARSPLHRLPPAAIARAAVLYRAACADLMRAESLGLGTDVRAHLDALIARGHGALYGPRQYSGRAALRLVTRTFPATLRRRGGLFAIAAALFFVPLVAGAIGALRSEEFAFSIIPKVMLEQAVAGYSNGVSRGGAGADAAMAGFYVWNNVGIAFRCFATGILFGAGSVFFLFYNGLSIGATLGFVIRGGAGENIITFVSGHSAFELTAIVIAGTAGLCMGVALVATDGRTRWGSLRASSRDVGVLVLGAAAFLLVAAAIEGFWSASAATPPVKWVFGGTGIIAVTLFLLLAGQERATERRDAMTERRDPTAEGPEA
jgi:uncharacterized membrane protein SpoIIM required for sporulation